MYATKIRKSFHIHKLTTIGYSKDIFEMLLGREMGSAPSVGEQGYQMTLGSAS